MKGYQKLAAAVLIILVVLPSATVAQTASGQFILHNVEVGFTVLHQGQFKIDGSFSAKQIKAIHSVKEYKAALADYSHATVKDVDFSKGQVLLLDIGSRSTGGYSVDVTSIEDNKDYIVVKVAIYAPSPNCMLIQTLTNPFQFSYISSRKDMVIVEKMVYRVC